MIWVENHNSAAGALQLVKELIRRKLQFAVRHNADGTYEITYHED